MRYKNLNSLAQMPISHEGKSRLPFLAALVFVSLFSVAAAFGIAPDTITRTVPTHTVVEPINLNLSISAEASPSAFGFQDKVRQGDTVASLLARLNIDDEDAENFIRKDPVGQGLYQLRPGRIVRAQTTEDGDLLSLVYLNSQDNMLVVEKNGDGFKASEQPIAPTVRTVFKSGSIRSSLFGATDAAGIPDTVTMQMAKIFSTSIDFHQDLRRGDKFSVVYEMLYQNGEPVRVGKVLTAEFINQNKSYRVAYFESPEGDGDYYTPDGRNLRKAFLRSPIEFSRVSSGFSSSRFHPILNKWRAHKGVDFAAPSGTGILATADGRVSFVGSKSGYGNVVEIKHHENYTTLYAHLSRFGKISKGEKIRQGEIIGYVGRTGLATGPHLHYEFKVAGAHQDPLTVAPLSQPMPVADRPAFDKTSKILMAQLELLRGTNLARFE
ncbi:MAG: peptidoglycan DD-metalloendopeptidase family protein [Burkholderiales bacterium]